jgi:hypothetical protein
MFVKPVYLKRKYKPPQCKAAPPPMKQVSPETPHPIGFNPTATVTNQIVIAR